MKSEYRENLRRAREAADWLLRLESEGQACHAAFFKWVMSSPQHVREFLAVSKLSRYLDQVDPNRAIDATVLIRQISSGVVPFPSTQVSPNGHRRGFGKAERLWAVGIAATVLLFGVLGFIGSLQIGTSPTYATGLGEQRSFKLPDGSVVHLNAASVIDVHYSATSRDVQLVEGEALFSVEHDPQRPFRVTSGSVVAQALGTKFDVNRHARGTVVSVVEGRVAVSVAGDDIAPTATVVRGGEQVSVEQTGAVQRRRMADAEHAVSWRERRLVFQDSPLGDVASEFNRYNVPRLEVEGAEVRDKRISGVFSADHPQALLLYLQRDESLILEQRGDAVVIRQR